ncbi:SDR family NAD(P)-dependent oxidoreductase [Actinokineospora bangkokensis]|uniref:Probable oxidoreductase n=1 Tax=Actinokineospora bangkokensis TaxID=1193682 RepID=A0A1Q9LMU3_9PSEU|nr:SDR family NAD(P)-dependent oxidoreductase [Actinokineospora bangkokensis]OLR93366.1 oxidoreductase [Actinokineospora bangkokensis]
MADKQRPVGSPFTASSTATEVLAGIDLTGKLVLMTGGYSGIGLPATQALVAAGARVVVPARRPEVAAEALAGVEGVEVAAMDLADQGSIAAFADGFLDSGRDLHLVITSAGIMATPFSTVGHGWESQFGVNHLGHFALVNRLWPAIARGGGRVVALSSAGHRRGGIRWDDVDFATGYDRWVAYGQAKTANALFAVHLDALGREQGVRAFSVHPGGINTPLQRHLSHEDMMAAGWVDESGEWIVDWLKTPEQGAATQVWAATSPLLDGLGGLYCEDCEVAEVAPDDDPDRGGVRSWATDPEQAARLWALSADRTGVDAFA